MTTQCTIERTTEPAYEAPRPETYAMGYSATFMELLKRRTAWSSAQYLLRHLRSGMDLLDLGCGPGTITAGLATRVFPGRAYGLDREERQLEMARDTARRMGVQNVRFQRGDALALPFPDDSFDAVHCHGFLMHSPGIREQMGEIVRVLRPGGILGARDMDVSTSFISPAGQENRSMWEMLARVIRLEGGDPLMGRHLKTFLRNAGLEVLEIGFDADAFTTPEDVEFLARFLTEWGLSEKFMRMTGACPESFQQWKQQVERWSRHPGAVGCFRFGHAVGRKPGRD